MRRQLLDPYRPPGAVPRGSRQQARARGAGTARRAPARPRPREGAGPRREEVEAARMGGKARVGEGRRHFRNLIGKGGGLEERLPVAQRVSGEASRKPSLAS